VKFFTLLSTEKDVTGAQRKFHASLVTAIKEGMAEKIQMLLNQEPGIINLRDRYDSTPLMRGKCLIDNNFFEGIRKSEQFNRQLFPSLPFFSTE
jgi:hypothetical protein